MGEFAIDKSEVHFKNMSPILIEPILREKVLSIVTVEDPAHDILHIERVVSMAKQITEVEGGDLNVIIPAAWLHDCVIIPKSDPRRSFASRLSALSAVQFLRDYEYGQGLLDEIYHAIEAHSFSAKISCRTLEAKIVQDADRLDGLGAIGVARCFATAGLLGRHFYESDDPFCVNRLPDDSMFTLDHFDQKLFRTVETLQTEAGRKEGKLRAESMKQWIESLKRELRSISISDREFQKILVGAKDLDLATKSIF